MIQFEVTCETSLGQMVGVCGTDPLGDWDVSRCLVLHPTNYPVWSGQATAGSGPFEYKYVLVNANDGDGCAPSLISWEGSFPNRRVDARGEGTTRIILNDVFGDPERSSHEAVVQLGDESHGGGDRHTKKEKYISSIQISVSKSDRS